MVQAADIKTWAIQAEDNTADHGRFVASAVLSEGVIGKAADSFKVAQDTGSNMQIKVGSGTIGDLVAIRGDAVNGQGIYVAEHQSGTVTLSVAASDPSQNRIDRVIARLYDDEADSSGNNYVDVEVLTGTPAGSPSAPAVPDSAISLATIEVDANVTAVTNADITDTRVSARGGGAVPGGQLGYGESTSNVGPFSTTTSLASVTATLPANRRIKLTGSWQSWSTTAANDRARFELFATSVRMEQISKNTESGVAKEGGSIVAVFDSGAGGSVSCLLRALRHSGTGAITVVGSSTAPISIVVEDLGPS